MKLYSDMTESEMTRRMCKTLVLAGADVTPLVGAMMQRPGLPDRFVAHSTWHGFLEAKRRDSRLALCQQHFHISTVARNTPCMIARYNTDLDLFVIGVWRNGREEPCGALPLGVALGETQQEGHALLRALRDAWEARNK